MSLKYRIAIVIFLLEAVMMAAVLWKALGHAVASSDHQIKATEQAALDIVSNIGRIALLDEDFDRVQGYIEALTKNPNILKAMLVDERGIIVASSTFGDLGEKLVPLSNGATDHWSTIEISNPAGKLGLLAVQFSDQARLASYRGALNKGIVIAAVGMGVIAVFGVGFGYLLTLRLQRLAHAAKQISLGNYNVRSGLHGRDEIARVGAAFDNMTTVIAAERQALADANRELDARVRERTRDLEEANREHKAFAYAISHDLRAPLRALSGFSQALQEDCAAQLDDTARDYLNRIQNGAKRMGELIEGLLRLSRVSQVEISHEQLDLSALCSEVVEELRREQPEREVQVDIQPGVRGEGDRQLLSDVLGNLMGNAWKFTTKTPHPSIGFGARPENGITVYYVQDNGAGFDKAYADKLFTPFQRLHHERDFPGAGIGLSTVRRIIQRHNGDVWAESSAGEGSTFYFTLHAARPDDAASDQARSPT